jgi:hypothetical protein
MNFPLPYSQLATAGRFGDRIRPVPVTKRSEARVYGRSFAGIAGSNPAGCTHVCVVYCREISDMRTQRYTMDKKGGTKQRKERTNKQTNPGGGDIFRTGPEGPWGPPSLLYNGHRVCFPGVKQPGRDVNHIPPSNDEVKERVELHFYSISPSWPVVGRNLPSHST